MTAIDVHMANAIATTSYYEGRLEVIDSKLRDLLQRAPISGDDNNNNDNNKECNRLRAEKESTKQCLKICAEASRNVSRRLQKEPRAKASGGDKDAVEVHQGRENTTSNQGCIPIQSCQDTEKVDTNIFKDVLAARDSLQVIAVASENLFSVVRVTAEAGATQLIGHMSSSILEELLQDRARFHEA